MREQAVDPVAVHDRVGVEQNDVAVRMQRQGAIDRSDEAEIDLVFEIGEQAPAGEITQLPGDALVRTAIVDNDQFEAALLRRGENSLDRREVSSYPS